jgi:imidazolonepropionase-like amidohydrolase
MSMSEAYASYAGWKAGTPPPADLILKRASFRAALDSGVTIVNGSDMGVFAHGDGVRELELLVAHGMSPMQALHAATGAAAKALRLDHLVGRIQSGLEADLIAVEGNPCQEIAALRKMRCVMKSGELFKAP